VTAIFREPHKRDFFAAAITPAAAAHQRGVCAWRALVKASRRHFLYGALLRAPARP